MVIFTAYHKKKRFADWRDPPTQCDCCAGPIELVDNSVLYNGRSYGAWPWVYFCQACKASVGCHPHSVYPLGTMATPKVRQARNALHKLLDPLWRSGQMTRSKLYAEVACRLDYPAGRAFHIGELSLEECQEAHQILAPWVAAVDFCD